MEKSFEKRIVFFTGGTSGLGREAVLALALHGAKVVVTVRNKAKGDELLKTFHATKANSKGDIRQVAASIHRLQQILQQRVFDKYHGHKLQFPSN